MQDVFVFPTRECAEHRMQRACIHTTCSKCNILVLAILLRGWNFSSGSMTVVNCIVTSCAIQSRWCHNTHNSHVWADNPHATVESNFQIHFSVNVGCAVLDDQLIGPFILEGRPTGEENLRFLQEELPRLLENVPLNKRGRMFFQHDGAPHSSREIRNFLNYRFPERWIGCGGPHNWPNRSTDLSPLDSSEWGWIKELVCSVKVVTRDALLGRILGATDRIRKSAESESNYPPSSQPSGSLCCGLRWHFRKPALSTDQFKLKVISRTQLYIYTSKYHVLCWFIVFSVYCQ